MAAQRAAAETAVVGAGESKVAAPRIEAKESARRARPTIGCRRARETAVERLVTGGRMEPQQTATEETGATSRCMH